jgi:hypothetical protein
MWQTLSRGAISGTDREDPLIQLLVSTLRTIVTITGVAYAVWHVVATTLWPRQSICVRRATTSGPLGAYEDRSCIDISPNRRSRLEMHKLYMVRRRQRSWQTP